MLAYVASQAESQRTAKDGVTQRAHWEAAAKRGNVDALAKLEGTPYPDALGYLYEWFLELSNARGASGMGGIAGLTYEGIAAWARLTDRQPEPYEIDALFQIDLAWRSAMRDDAAPPTTEPAVSTERPWPTKQVTQVTHA